MNVLEECLLILGVLPGKGSGKQTKSSKKKKEAKK